MKALLGSQGHGYGSKKKVYPASALGSEAQTVRTYLEVEKLVELLGSLMLAGWRLLGRSKEFMGSLPAAEDVQLPDRGRFADSAWYHSLGGRPLWLAVVDVEVERGAAR